MNGENSNFFEGCDVVAGMKKDLTDCCHILYTTYFGEVSLTQKRDWFGRISGLFCSQFPCLKERSM